jgi:hypothetical protein
LAFLFELVGFCVTDMMVNILSGFKSFMIASAVLQSAIAGPVFLSPVQDIILPSSESATSPLTQLGANSPWFAGKFVLVSVKDFISLGEVFR